MYLLQNISLLRLVLWYIYLSLMNQSSKCKQETIIYNLNVNVSLPTQLKQRKIAIH